MIRSMSTAVTGLRGHQQKLDVIGNNIANVNTVAFKKSQARFEDLLSQTIQGATAPMTRGGINPSQVGMGMRVSSITDIHSQGAITSTDRETDMAIEGEGFFIVSDGESPDGQYRPFFTRDGSFGLDANGTLVNANGFMLLGDLGRGFNEPITIPLGFDMIAQATENLRFAGNIDARLKPTFSLSIEGATTGDYIISVAVGGGAPQEATLAFDATAEDIRAALEGLGAIESVSVTGLGSAANPFKIVFNSTIPADAAVELTVQADPLDPADGTISSDFAAHGYEYYLYDSLGNRYNVDFSFTRTDLNQWAYSVKVFDENGVQMPIADGDSGALHFSPSGTLLDTSVIRPLEFNPPAADPMVVQLGFDNVTQYAGGANLSVREQDGFASGTLVAFYISRTGMVVGTYTNGMVESLGQIVLSTFSNPEGLLKTGGNLYLPTPNSGDQAMTMPGGGGAGLIQSSALEMSNTDLAYEFTELITTSRAFQANTRVVTTSDEVLVEVINMKR